MNPVIFDMDGVIFDSERALLQCWIDIAREHALDEELVRKTYFQCIGTNRRQTEEIYRNAFLGIWGEERMRRIWKESAERFRERYSDRALPLKAGVKEILEYLKAAGIPAGIASSTQKQTVPCCRASSRSRIRCWYQT